MGRIKPFLQHLWTFRKSLIVFLAPIVFLPVPLVYDSEAGRCAYAIMIMGAYWVTEAIPMAATALLPVVLMPWLGVLGSKKICTNYLKDGNMLFVGGLMVAVAVEKWNLHRRIALRVLLIVGSKPKWLMFGFMSTTAFLSMWISNTATTAMMVPIVEAVIVSLEGKGGIVDRRKSLQQTAIIRRKSSVRDLEKHEVEELARLYDDGTDDGPYEEKTSQRVVMLDDVSDTEETALDDPPRTPRVKIQPEATVHEHHVETAHERELKNIAIGLCLCVAYAANIGGTATLTGTPPNIVLKGQINTLYGPNVGVSFVSWLIIAFPNMLICLFLAWIWLQFMYLGPRELFSFCKCLQKKKKFVDEDDDQDEASAAAAAVIRREYEKLGSMTFAEVAVLIHFIVLVLLWITREPEFVPGYSEFLKPGYVTDACVAITVSLGLFICPSRRPNFLCCRKKGGSDKGPVPALLDWETVHQKMAWSVVILLGGGFALADACKASGLSIAIGNAFAGFGNFPVWVLVLVLCTVTAAFTEVTSNVATCTIFIPILAELAETLHVNPLYLIIPVTISSSFAFMLPVATPPNAIVFAYGRLRIIDMVKTGIVMNIVCILVLQLSVNTWGKAYFDLDTYPDWAEQPLTTAATVNITVVPTVVWSSP